MPQQPKQTDLPLSVERPETAARPQVAIDPTELGLPPAVGEITPENETVTLTKAELADLVASAAAAAVNAHAAGASPTTMRAAALRAVE